MTGVRKVALLLVFVAIGRAPAQTSLNWKFEPGQRYEAERIATRKQSVKLNGKTFNQERASVWRVRLEVKERKGAAFLIDAMLAKVEHKLTGVPAAEMLDPKLDSKIQGARFLLTVTPAGTIQQMQGYEQLLKRLGDPGKVREAIAEATLRDGFADLFGPLPDTPVKPGATWQREKVEPIPHFGALRSTTHYRWDGTTIAFTIATKFEKPVPEMTAVFRVVDGKLASEKGRGTIAFDHKAGRLVSHERSMALRGELTLESMKRRYPVEFTSEEQVKIRVR
ncbi:MAG: hypothetical protein HYX68_16485 [Planctomycetes bacterium]|nr:hypothetical protein [Planctomycetota bacterium]